MPQIKIRGVDVAKVQAISRGLIDNLQKIIDCPRDDITLECITSTFIQDGSIVQGYPYVEIAWFDRGQEIQDQVAKVVTHFFLQARCNSVDVIFVKLVKNSYYENGEHF